MTNNKQQTAVEWFAMKLAEKLGMPNAISFYVDNEKEILQAKEMEKHFHAETWVEALDYGIKNLKGLNDLSSKEAFEQYYNETYGGNK